ncbi:MAG: hypothetical protein KTR14_08520 [Vampirovibrio sp.]|nr:hypothetical protein [Vampirovibrio sp.]
MTESKELNPKDNPVEYNEALIRPGMDFGTFGWILIVGLPALLLLLIATK